MPRSLSLLLGIAVLQLGCASKAETASRPALQQPTTEQVRAGAAPAERVAAAHAAFEHALHRLVLEGGAEQGLAERACVWSSRWRDAELAVDPNPPSRAARAAAEREHLHRVRDLVGLELLKHRHHNVTRLDLAAVNYFVRDAEDRLARLSR